jgi:hypothetical protein
MPLKFLPRPAGSVPPEEVMGMLNELFAKVSGRKHKGVGPK